MKNKLNDISKQLLRVATKLGETEGDILVKAAEKLIALAEKNHSIHVTSKRGGEGVLCTVDVREKLPLSNDSWSGSGSMEPVESFSFTGKNLQEARAKAEPTINSLKSKYGLTQVLESTSV